ncbi:hypothetical protein [Streptomyces sp. NPDC006638]|uniref:hypothetical protein n=1 Tax=Streptomyces sp. NPDC006638 TaxID=3157183 RepID=UPI0033B6812E
MTGGGGDVPWWEEYGGVQDENTGVVAFPTVITTFTADGAMLQRLRRPGPEARRRDGAAEHTPGATAYPHQ